MGLNSSQELLPECTALVRPDLRAPFQFMWSTLQRSANAHGSIGVSAIFIYHSHVFVRRLYCLDWQSLLLGFVVSKAGIVNLFCSKSCLKKLVNIWPTIWSKTWSKSVPKSGRSLAKNLVNIWPKMVQYTAECSQMEINPRFKLKQIQIKK